MTGINKRSTDPKADQSRLQQLKDWMVATRAVKEDITKRKISDPDKINAALRRASGK